ncbi:acyl-CoA N-acyltransferase [Macrophomina phaseolina]|uniref:Acyl-CoA N-acyltransferase n=1 Tax=Macrophomina phaseolina TaxID=35725 RepID=A0ABQ8G0F6_9PEZI|nr:acyl-CoA N-acyltransferase [Macrophomina phaseolina]
MTASKGAQMFTALPRHVSISISIASDCQGQGYGAEAINWILDWVFEVAGLHRVAITSFAYNEPTCRLYERLGFVLEGRRREALWFRGRFHDMLLFLMLR